jgi:hypothetical protein
MRREAAGLLNPPKRNNICAQMANNDVNLEALVRDGRKTMSISHASHAHSAFERWCEDVSNWLDEKYPGSGLSAQWSGLPPSLLVVANRYDNSDATRVYFYKVVTDRMQWLGSLGTVLSERADNRASETQESDAVFAESVELVEAGPLPQLFKRVISSDIAEAQKSYRAEAYKGCVVMLGAALEGVMLGTLQRSDVITFLSTSSEVPGPIRRLGSRNPALSDKIGNELSFEDYKVCVEDLIRGVDALGVDNIQDFRNAIHPWKSIQEPLKYGTFDRPRALHHLASFHKILQALSNWVPC